MKQKILYINHLILLVFLIIILILSLTTKSEIFIANLFGKKVNLVVVMLLMFIFEFLSTLMFQLRMKLTAKFENTKDKKLVGLVPLIAGLSWLIAGTQGIFLIGDSDNIGRTLLKFVPVFIATFNGVYVVMRGKLNAL